jgi:hypothetical protein
LNGYEQRCYKKAEVAFELRAKVASLAFARLEQRLNGYELSSKCYKKAEVGLELA